MSRYRFDAGMAAARKDARVVRESIVKRAKAPASSGSVVRKLIYSDMDQARQCRRQAPSNLYRRRR